MTAYLQHKDLANTIIDAQRIEQIRDGMKKTFDRLHEAEQKAGRPEGSVTLLAATKTRDVGEIMAALSAGITTIGENRPQEVQIKAPVLQRCLQDRDQTEDDADNADRNHAEDDVDGSEHALTWPDLHLIGQLQKNKINKVLPYVATIESVESAQEAQNIATRVAGKAPSGKVKIFFEVNESGEASKSGCDPNRAYDEALQIAALSQENPTIELAGLMTIGAHVDDEKQVRAGFAALRELGEKIRTSGESGTDTCRQLSMGMTHDCELAVEEGSTQVRVGTGIFGERAFI